MHIKTLPHQAGGRLFVIGELFGHFPAMNSWMAEVSFKTQSDRVILLGNFLGYAASSRQAHHYLSQPWLDAVMGPNEAQVLARLDSGFADCEGSLIGQWLGGMSPSERAMLHQQLRQVPVAIEYENDEGLVVLGNRPLPEDVAWERVRSDIERSPNATQALALFMNRIGTLKCLGMLPGGPQRPAAGVHLNVSSYSLENPLASHKARHNRIIVTTSACTAHGAQYEHQSLLRSLELNHLPTSIQQVKTWDLSLDVRHALYPTSSSNTNMH